MWPWLTTRRQLFETFKDKKVALLGAGEMGEETLRYLHDEGARYCDSQSKRPRADALAAKLGRAAPIRGRIWISDSLGPIS